MSTRQGLPNLPDDQAESYPRRFYFLVIVDSKFELGGILKCRFPWFFLPQHWPSEDCISWDLKHQQFQDIFILQTSKKNVPVRILRMPVI